LSEAGIPAPLGDILTELVGLSASGNLGVQAGIDFALKLGLDLGGTNRAFFIDVNETGFTGSASAQGSNLSFDAALGPVGVYIQNGRARIGGSFEIAIDAGAGAADGRLVLVGFDGSSVDTEIDDLLDFVDEIGRAHV